MSAPGPALRPERLGTVIDRATGLWREHWRPLFQLALPYQLAQYAGLKGAELLGGRLFPRARDPLALLSAGPRGAAGALPELVGLLLVLSTSLLLTFFLAQLGGVAITHYLVPRLTGAGAPPPSASARHALTRLGPASGAFGLALAWTAAAAAAWLAPGVAAAGAGLWGLDHLSSGAALALLVTGALAAGVAVVGLLLWFILRFILLAQVLGAEGGSALDAFRRTGALASGRVGAGPGGWVKLRLAVVLTVMGAILLLVSVVASAPSLALGASYGAGVRPGQSLEDLVPQAVLVPVQLLQVVVGALFAPISEAIKVAFYLDLRVRREGLDLELRLG